MNPYEGGKLKVTTARKGHEVREHDSFWPWLLAWVLGLGWRLGLTLVAIYTVYQLTDGRVPYPVLFLVSGITVLVTRVWARYP